MKISVLFFSLLLGLVSAPAFGWSPSSPTFPALGLVPQADIRLFINAQRFSFLFETTGRAGTDGVKSVLGTIGSYFQPWDFLRVGLFYRKQWGTRQDADWVWSDTANNWVWTNVNGRSDDILIADVTPRALIPYLPGKDWVGELRTRYEYSTLARSHTLLLRPGVRYFLLDDGNPTWQFYGTFEARLGLNYGRSLLNETSTYLGALHFFSRWFQAGLYTGLWSQNWSSTSFYTANTTPASTYLVTQLSWFVGLNAVFQIHL